MTPRARSAGRSRSSAAASGGRRAATSTPSLLERSGGDEVVVLPTAAAFEHPDRVVERATRLLRRARRQRSAALPVLHRADAEDDDDRRGDRATPRFVYLADGSPLHLRSVLKDSRAVRRARSHAYRQRRGARGVGRGRDRAVRPDGRPARRRLHRRARRRARASRCSRTTAPRPTTCASARSTCCPSTPCSSGSTRQTALVRDPAPARGEVDGRRRDVTRRTAGGASRSTSCVDGGSHELDAVVAEVVSPSRLGDRHLVDRDVRRSAGRRPLDGASVSIFCATSRPVVTVPNAPYWYGSVRQSCRRPGRSPVDDEELRAGACPPARRRSWRTRPSRPGSRRSGPRRRPCSPGPPLPSPFGSPPWITKSFDDAVEAEPVVEAARWRGTRSC